MASEKGSDTCPDTSEQDEGDIEDKIFAEHRSIPKDTRRSVLEGDGNRCQINGCLGRAHNGSARLVVQWIDKPQGHPEEPDLDDLETRCLRCSLWIKQMPTTEDLRPRIKQRLGGVTIEPPRAEILQYLAEEGPAPTGEIQENVNLDSKLGVRRSLYSLMGLDIREDEIDQRIVLKDRTDQTYGLPWQVPDEHDARGFVPIQPAKLRNRILDELVCRLYLHLESITENPQEIIADIVDRKPRQILHMRRRGEAFQFPFEQWADRKQSREDPSAIIAAVDALAGETNNLSRQLLSRNIASVYDKNDEQALADVLRGWADGEDISPYVESHRTTPGAVGEEDTAEETESANPGSQSGIHQTVPSQLDGEKQACDVQVLEEVDIQIDGEGSEMAEFDPRHTDYSDEDLKDNE